MLKVKCPKRRVNTLSFIFLRQAVVFKSESHFIRAVYGKKQAARDLKNRSRKLADLTDAESVCILSDKAAKAF